MKMFMVFLAVVMMMLSGCDNNCTVHDAGDCQHVICGDSVEAIMCNGEDGTSGKDGMDAIGTYCGHTEKLYDGNLGGWQNSKLLCQAACGDDAAHQCTSAEITHSWRSGVEVPAGGWVTTNTIFWWYDESSGGNWKYMRDCFGWKSQSGYEYGAVTSEDSADDGWLNASSCNWERPLVCCK
jgi:hypothetical protein